MKDFFVIKENFLESLIIRVGCLLLLIFGIALIFTVLEKYLIFQVLLPFILIMVIIFVILFIYFNRHTIEFKKNKIDYFVICFILVFCVINSFHFSEYLIEGGHDQGGYLESGILLAKTGSLYLDPEENPIAYAVPGFWPYPNGLLRHHFIPGNAVFISIFYTLFDFTGVRIANSFLLFFSASIIYFLIKRIRNWKAGVFWILFFLLNFYTIYFSRATYVENLQLFFTWFYIYLFIKGYQKKDFQFLIYSFVPLSLLMTVRLEAFLYVIIYCLVVLFFIFKKTLTIDKKKWVKYLISLLFGVIIITSLFVFDSSFLDPALNFIKKNKLEASLAWGESEEIPYNQQVYIFVSLFYIFTSAVVIAVFMGILNFFREDKKIKKIILLISILILPQFVLLIRPGIAFYLPWFMRRFWAVFIPFVLLLLVLFISNDRNILKSHFKKILVTLTVLIFLVITIPGFSILFKTYGKGILEFESKVASYFSEDDLVIFWDRYKYENFGPPLYFLHNTNVAFDRMPAFDPEIYALMMKRYNNIYIATSKWPEEDLGHPYFTEHVEFIQNITSPEIKLLASKCDIRRFLAYPKTFDGYYQLADLCKKNNPPSKIYNSKIYFNIYRIKNEFVDQFILENYDPDYIIEKPGTKNIWH